MLLFEWIWSWVVSQSKFDRPLKETNLDMEQALCDLYKTSLLLIDQDHKRKNVFNFFASTLDETFMVENPDFPLWAA